MYLKKEISISFLIITISASNLYMPMIWSYVFLLDFLIPFLCGPDLQCAFTFESTHFFFNKCPIYTYDGASAKFSTNSQETDYSAA